MDSTHSLFLRQKKINSPVLNPILRAYALGYLSATGPRLISFLGILRRKDLSKEDKLRHLLRILCGPLQWNRFPAFCSLIAGGSTALPILIHSLSRFIAKALGSKSRFISSPGWARVVRFLSIFLSASLGFQVLNQKKTTASSSRVCPSPNNDGNGSPDISDAPESQELGRHMPVLAGRTLDLSLFAVTRAVDVLVNISWDSWKRRRKASNRWTSLEALTPPLADASVFAVSSAIVMWAWFYLPERLPSSYGRWIGEAAQVDSRLIEVLRRARRGTWIYGKDTSQAPLLQSMCKDYGWPMEWGDPAQTIPMPCEMVHMGCGPSCEKHALMRFVKTFKFACATYIPLQIALRWRSRSIHAFVDASKNAVRSSAFLGLFVSIFYYSVCLARTRLGPKLFSLSTVTRIMWDSGLCVGAGCMLCGWSILAENPKKRPEIAMFVAPRAVATLVPRRYERKYQWRESVAFSLSTAVVLSTIQEQPEMVRGFMGKLLGQVFQ